jgi:hypothetical protein
MGTCEGGSCAGTFACTEAGIREAIAAGAGPHTFECNGQTTVTTNAEIGIDNDVILDGEGNLTVEGNLDHIDGLDLGVFLVPDGVTAELRGFTVTGGSETGGMLPPMAGIRNDGTLTLTNTTVTENGDFGIINFRATMTLAGCTISDNPRGILNNDSTLALTDSTMSNNEELAIDNDGEVLITNSTVSFGEGSSGVHSNRGLSAITVINSTFRANGVLAGPAISVENDSPPVKIAATVVDGECAGDITSNGYNIESSGDTCGFDQGTDQTGVSADDLKLGPLADNGGPTMTHALEAGSVAIDVIPADMCEVDTDQRGEPRFVGLPFGPLEPVGDGCDVGAFEVQPPAAESCTQSGGTVSTALCCQAVESFPNTCAIGACGCAPDASHEVDVCICPTNTCFDGESCVTQ